MTDASTRERTAVVKCLIWDLDETVWSGRILDGDTPVLRPGVVEVMAELDRRGILQSVASTNEHRTAWAWIERFGLEPFLLAPEIGFERKQESVRRVASTLDVRLTDVGFIDDEPMERELVASLLPEVSVFDAADYLSLLDDPRFSPNRITEDARNRRSYVQADLERQRASRDEPDLLAFLCGCRITFEGRRAALANIDRIVELSTRVNRMNASGCAFGPDDVRAAIADPDRIVLVGSLEDRFGAYGMVAAAVMVRAGEACTVTGLWMSCRAGKSGLPATFLTYLGQEAIEVGATRLEVSYTPGSTNRLAALHLGTYGFTLGRSQDPPSYELALPGGLRPYEDWIEVR